MKMADLNLVVVAKQDVGRDVLRDIIRKCGVRSLQMYSSASEMLSALKSQVKRWNIFIVDGSFPDSLETVANARKTGGENLKILIIFSGPTKEQILDAIKAGANDFLAMPYSQITVEEKLNKLMGVEKRAPDPRANIFQRRL